MAVTTEAGMPSQVEHVRAVANALGRDYEAGVEAGRNGARGQVRIAGPQTLPSGLGNWILTFLTAWLTAVSSQRCFVMDHPVLLRLFAPGEYSLSCGRDASQRWSALRATTFKQVGAQRMAAACARPGNVAVSWMAQPFTEMPKYGQHGLVKALEKAGATKNETADMAFINAVAAHWLLTKLTPEADAALNDYLEYLTDGCAGRGIAAAVHLRTGDKSERANPTSIRHWQGCMAEWTGGAAGGGGAGGRGCETLFAMSDSPPAIDAVLDSIRLRMRGSRWNIVPEHTVRGVRPVDVQHPTRPNVTLPLWFGPTGSVLTPAEWSALRWHSGILLNLARINASYVVHHASVLGWLAFSTAREHLMLEGGSTFSTSAHLRGMALPLEGHRPQVDTIGSTVPLLSCRRSAAQNGSFWK